MKAAHEFSENKQKINHFLYMYDLKLYSRSEKGLDSLVQTVCVFSESIGMEFGISIRNSPQQSANAEAFAKAYLHFIVFASAIKMPRQLNS